MAVYYKPQSPIKSGEDFIYPITTADQIMKSDKTRRLEQAGLIVADNSTSLGGVAAKDYALKTDTAPDSSKLGGVAASGYALKTDTAPDSSKLGGKAPEYYLQPRNLLDNSDFTNPVNQRGQTSYTSAGYTIDRWKKEGASTVTVSDSCVTIDNTGNSAEEVFIQQTDRSAAQKLIGKALTIAICVDGGTIYCGSGIVDNDANSIVIYTERFDLSLHYFTSFNSYQTARLIVKPGKSVSVKWIALYEGSYTVDTLPPYVPKGYATELAECRRYYKRFTSPNAAIICAGYVTGGTKCIYFNAPDNQPMRIVKPSCTFIGLITVRGINGYIAEDYSGGVFTVYANATGCISMIEITRGDSAAWNATNNTPVFVNFHGDSVFELIADL